MKPKIDPGPYGHTSTSSLGTGKLAQAILSILSKVLKDHCRGAGEPRHVLQSHHWKAAEEQWPGPEAWQQLGPLHICESSSDFGVTKALSV